MKVRAIEFVLIGLGVAVIGASVHLQALKQPVGPFLVASNVAVGETATRIRLEPLSKGVTLKQRLVALPETHRVFVIFRGRSVKQDPGTKYSVLLDLPDGATKTSDFEIDSVELIRQGAPAETSSIFVSLDITDLARRLAKDNRLPEVTTLTLIPVGTPKVGTHVVISSIEVNEQPVR